MVAGVTGAMLLAGMLVPLLAVQPSSSRAAPDNSQSNLVVALGDSVTAAYGVPPGKSYPDFLEEYLYDSGYPYRVLNFGRNGATTSYGVVSLLAIERRGPALVIVMLGANDKIGGMPISQTATNLDQIVSSLQGSGSEVILAEQPLSQDYGADYIRQFHTMFTVLAQRYHCPLDTDLYRDMTDVPGMLQADGVHPTADGQAQLAHNLLPLVKPALIKHPRRKRHR